MEWRIARRGDAPADRPMPAVAGPRRFNALSRFCRNRGANPLPIMDELGLAEFQAASKVQMDDGVNFLQEMIAYRSIGDATQTVSDRTGVAAPDGHDGLLRHLLFLRRREGVAPAAGS